MTVAFITGVTGQDGGYLVDRLLSEGADVVGLVRRMDGDARALSERAPEVKLVEGDLADVGRVQQLIEQVRPDEVYNLAGISSVASSWQFPVATGAVTGLAVAGLLEATRLLTEKRGNQVRVFQASSSEIFGNPAESPQTEETPLRPTSPYGAAKAYAQSMVRMYRARGLAVSSCILYNHESPRRPETFVTRKITAAAARIALGQQDVLELGAMDVRRDWGWAPDYVDAMVRATRHSVSDDYIIATGEQHSIEEFVAAAFEAAGVSDWRDRVRTNPEFIRPAEISTMLGDPSKARRQLGWAPTVTFLELVERMVAVDLERFGR